MAVSCLEGTWFSLSRWYLSQLYFGDRSKRDYMVVGWWRRKRIFFFSKFTAAGCCKTKSVPRKETREAREDVDETTLARTSVWNYLRKRWWETLPCQTNYPLSLTVFSFLFFFSLSLSLSISSNSFARALRPSKCHSCHPSTRNFTRVRF